MQRKAAAKRTSCGGADGTAEVSSKLKESTTLKSVKRTETRSKTPAGKGLGKAGAKRLGRMLKRAIQPQEEPSGTKRVSLPKTPVRLLKHQIEAKAKNAPGTNSSKLTSPQVSKLILSLVFQCKHKAGISMAEIKQTLAAQGYDVTKNNRQVNMVTKRLVSNKTLVETKGNASFRLNKQITETMQTKKNPVINKPKLELKKSYPASKSSKAAEKSQRRNNKTPKPRGKLQRPKGKTNNAAMKKQPVKTPKPTAKSQKQRRQAKKSAMPQRKTLRTTKNRAAQARKPPKKAKRTRRHQIKRNKRPNKSSQRRRLHKRNSTFKAQNRQTTRKKTYR